MVTGLVDQIPYCIQVYHILLRIDVSLTPFCFVVSAGKFSGCIKAVVSIKC